MFKVLHIVLGLQVGGLEKFVLNLTNVYQDQVQSTFLCLSDPKENDAIDSNHKIIRWDKGEGLSLSWALKIFHLVKNGNYDLIHTHNPSPHFYGAIAGFFARVPVVHTKHGRNYPKNFKKVLLNRFASFLSDRIIAVSSDAAEVCRQVEKIPAKKVLTILNGVDTQRFTPGDQIGLRAELDLSTDIFLLGIVARLSPEKNHALLLETCRLLKKGGYTAFHLVVIGDGPLRIDLQDKVNQYDLNKFVSFLGTRQDIPDLVRALDVFVLTSTTEGVSLTLLEAMSSCIPVIATDVGGNSEVVADGQTGFIVPQDSKSLVEKIILLIEDGSLRERMGKAGRERVLNKFTLQQVAEQYINVYRTLVARKHDK